MARKRSKSKKAQKPTEYERVVQQRGVHGRRFDPDDHKAVELEVSEDDILEEIDLRDVA